MDKEELKDAILNGDVGGVRRILRNTPALANQDLEFGVTPMGCAAKCGQSEVIKVLIEFGGDVNEANESGWTPMHIAAMKGHAEVVQLLHGLGGDVNKANQVVCDLFSEIFFLLLLWKNDSKFVSDSVDCIQGPAPHIFCFV
eukprot:c20749_g1_i6.p1 GENE.c20749_g1_i6~~c20749_g1_i6.p1  ORF type:complete len:152 (+),score=32.29 c20749_g1_i6:33-458(+)